MQGILLSNGQAYIKGEGSNGKQKEFILDITDKEGSQISAATGLSVEEFIERAPAYEAFEDLSFPEINEGLLRLFNKGMVLDRFPEIFQSDIEPQIIQRKMLEYETLLENSQIFNDVKNELEVLHLNNKKEPLVPREAYDFESTIDLASEVECKYLVNLLWSCRLHGIL